jgi:hypothetical protein
MISPTLGDDTIELELTPEQMQGLSQAAEAARLMAPAPVAVVVEPGPLAPTLPARRPIVEDAPARRAPQWHQTPIAKMVASTAVFVAFAWWSGSRLAGQPQPQPHVAAAVAPAVAIPRPAAVPATPEPTVQVINPFDRTEVFEFPAGTSDAESREKVAQILLQRARDRQSKWERIKPKATLRTASIYHSP